MAKISKKSDLKIAVFCGGAGTRMWPMSRRSKPKQFQALVGKKSLFRQTVERLLLGFEPENIFAVTGREYLNLVTAEAPEIPVENIIIEPEMRDSLAATGYLITVFSHRFPGCIVASLWADHIVKNERLFIRALKAAYKVAQKENCLVNIDVRPTYPSTDLGYIQIGRMVKAVDNFEVFGIVRQVEKPDLRRAKKFLNSWNYLWHVGYAVWPVEKMLSFYKKFTPEVYKHLKRIKENLGTDREQEVSLKEYSQIPRTSIDFAIFEKIPKGEWLDIPVDLGWSDIGIWSVLKDELAETKETNVVSGQNIDIGSSDCLIYGPNNKKIVATAGLRGMIIVDTGDALLVCPKEKAGEVKKLVEKLKEQKKNEYL